MKRFMAAVGWNARGCRMGYGGRGAPYPPSPLSPYVGRKGEHVTRMDVADSRLKWPEYELWCPGGMGLLCRSRISRRRRRLWSGWGFVRGRRWVGWDFRIWRRRWGRR